MKFFLSTNKSFISLVIECNITKNSSSDEWSDLFDLANILSTGAYMVIEVVGAVKVT
jgi:hypothetical protein